MAQRVSRATAVRVAEMVEADYGPGVFVKMGVEEDLPRGTWVVCLEGAGGDAPWPIEIASKVRDEFPEVYAEPYTSWALALYPNN